MNQYIKSSIVRILDHANAIVGAGFLVSNRHVMTCAHVVAQSLNVADDTTDAPEGMISFDFPLVESGNLLAGRVISWRPVRADNAIGTRIAEDIAVIEITGALPRGCQPAQPVMADDLWNRDFRAFGFPANFDEGTWADGKLKDEQSNGRVIIEDPRQTGYFVEPGFSGGPVWDEKLQAVVGMIVAADIRPQIRAAFLIPVRLLAEAWPSLSRPARSRFIVGDSIRNIPHQRNPNFTGREALLDDIKKSLASRQRVALAGLGGRGKTQLAIEHAYRYASDYRVVWWIRSEETATLGSEYAALAEPLGIVEEQVSDQRILIEAVRQWLENNSDWLLVFDNATTPEYLIECLPQSQNGHVLITSRHRDWSEIVPPMIVPLLDRAESIDFLIKRAEQDDRAMADALADELGDLPLALEHAGAYIRRVEGTSIAKYLELFRMRRREVMKRDKEPLGYKGTVATTWEMSFQEVEKESPGGAALLSLCAFLEPDDIPRDVVCAGAGRLPTELAEVVADELALDDAVAALLHYSLIEADENGWSIHRLVQAVMRDRMSEDDQKRWAEAAVRIVNDTFPFDSDDVRTWQECVRLLAHALAAAELSEVLQVALDATGRLLN